VRNVVIPAANTRDIEELPEDVRQQLKFEAVKSMDEVLAVVFREAVRPATTVAAHPPIPSAAPAPLPH
jgi:ATP-dependent Lon protease